LSPKKISPDEIICTEHFQENAPVPKIILQQKTESLQALDIRKSA